MKKVLVLMSMLTLVACQSYEPMKTEGGLASNSLAGSWEGKLVQFTTKELEDSDSSKVYEVIFLNCNDSPEFWLKRDETGFNKIYGNYNIESKSGNHLLSLMVDGGDWVETQTWTLVSISNAKATIQWNRMVSNPYIGEDEELRSFGQMGFGELAKISTHCNIWEEDANNSSQEDAASGTSA